MTPQQNRWWMQTHAMIPTPHVQDGALTVYFSGRDKNNVSHIGYAVLNPQNPTEVLEVSREPVLSPGRRGCFDDNGVTPSSVVEHDGRVFLYYIGWNPGYNVRMQLFGGLAISTDGGRSFERYSEAPIIERCRINPFLNTAPFVLNESDQWRMYYVSGTEWLHKDLPRYNIQIARSSNGMEWTREGDIAIDYRDADEMALARPWVTKDCDGVYRMWFSHKGDAASGSQYRLGFAHSANGDVWRRNDSLAGLEPSESGWDSEMIEYAAVIDHDGRSLMFYNGNGYGVDGFGVATQP